MAARKSEVDRPAWLVSLDRHIKAGRKVFLVNFNVEDEMVTTERTIESVKDMAMKAMDAKGFVAYSFAGYEFDSEETEILFRQLNDLPLPPKDPGERPSIGADESDVAINRKMGKYDEQKEAWDAWVAFITEQKKRFNREPMQCLPPIPTSPKDASFFINSFMIFNPVGALKEDGTEYPDTSEFVVVIDYASMMVPDGATASTSIEQKTLEVHLKKWSELGKTSPSIVMFATSLTDVSKWLYGRGSQISTIQVPYPDYNERYRYMKTLQKELPFKVEDGKGLEDIAKTSAGLSNKHMRSLVTEYVADGKTLTLKGVLEYKHQVLLEELAGLVEPVEPDHGFETVGGLDYIKDEFMRIADYILGDKKDLCPMGILLTGPPGTGKTYIAEGFAYNIGFNFIKMGTIKSKWVGESERNIARVFEIAKALAPVIIFVDEIDQEGSRGNEGDSGVSNHIFASILRFMSDTTLRGEIMWIAATNRPDLMDPAMKRPGRFDIRLALLYPSAVEREAIFRVMFLKYNFTPGRDVNYKELAKLSPGYSGADIEAICIEAARQADLDDSREISQRHLLSSLDDYILHHDTKAIKKMEKCALAECNSIRLVPEDRRAEFRKSKGVLSDMMEAEEPEDITFSFGGGDDNGDK